MSIQSSGRSKPTNKAVVATIPDVRHRTKRSALSSSQISLLRRLTGKNDGPAQFGGPDRKPAQRVSRAISDEQLSNAPVAKIPVVVLVRCLPLRFTRIYKSRNDFRSLLNRDKIS